MFSDSQKGYSQNRGGYNARSGRNGRMKRKKIDDISTVEETPTKPENQLEEISKNEPKVIDEIKS